MKNNIITFLVVCTFIGILIFIVHGIQKQQVNPKYNVIEIDGCEYIKLYKGIAHKGNCKNKIHENR